VTPLISMAFIGIDGSGKSTLAKAVSLELQKRGFATKLLRMKDRNNEIISYLEENDKGLLNLEMRLVASSFDLVCQYIGLKDKNYDYVIWDRYYHCLEAYYTALGVSIAWQKKLLTVLDEPDYVFLLDISPDRIACRGSAPKELENMDYLRIVREGYIKLSETGKITVMDSAREIDALKNEVLHHLGIYR
jgi:thymidylate kinase